MNRCDPVGPPAGCDRGELCLFLRMGAGQEARRGGRIADGDGDAATPAAAAAGMLPWRSVTSPSPRCDSLSAFVGGGRLMRVGQAPGTRANRDVWARSAAPVRAGAREPARRVMGPCRVTAGMSGRATRVTSRAPRHRPPRPAEGDPCRALPTLTGRRRISSGRSRTSTVSPSARPNRRRLSIGSTITSAPGARGRAGGFMAETDSYGPRRPPVQIT